MPEQFWWYVARSSGMVTLGLSGAAVIWGLLLSTRVIRRRSLPKWLLDLHRFLGGLTMAFLALHIGALVADSFVPFGLAEVTVPGASGWKTAAVSWGVISMYLLVAIEATSLLKRRMPAKLWRRTHYLSFGAFGLSLLHAATAGTDTSNRVYVLLALVMTLIVVFLTVVRVLASGRPAARAARGPRESELVGSRG